MATRLHSHTRATERATILGFLAGTALTSFAWWALLRALEVLA